MAPPLLMAARAQRSVNNNHHEGERILKSTITAIAAAVLATTAFAATPALAAKAKPAQPAMHPIPTVGVLPAINMVFDQAKRGVYLGFETSEELAAFNDLLERTYDVTLVYVFEALGPSSTGDVFINVIDESPDWPFASTAFLSAISAAYDYKQERQSKEADP